MQTREFQGDFETAYAATLSVLQDYGWQLDTIDKSSGIIQASSLKHEDVVGPEDDFRKQDPKAFAEWQRQMTEASGVAQLPEWTRWQQLTAHIEAWGAGTVRERVTIIACGSRPSTQRVVEEKRMFGLRNSEHVLTEPAREASVIIEDPSAYQRLFQDIERAIFIRMGLTRSGEQ